jgi:hypothetical protein
VGRVVKIIIIILLSITIPFVLLALYFYNLPELKEAKEFNKNFDLVQMGDSESKVISILGKPDSKENEFRIGQKEGFEEAYSRAAGSNSKYYLLWFKGFDIVFTVGINNKGQVSIKESGGT